LREKVRLLASLLLLLVLLLVEFFPCFAFFFDLEPMVVQSTFTSEYDRSPKHAVDVVVVVWYVCGRENDYVQPYRTKFPNETTREDEKTTCMETQF
jgi:hypothetical protein